MNILDERFMWPRDKLTTKEEGILDNVINKEEKIESLKEEIKDILLKNWLNEVDLDKYKTFNKKKNI